MKIKLGKLMSGETIVGRLNNDETELENCLLLQAMPAPDGQGLRIGIAPFWSPFSDDKANIELNKLICSPIDANEQLIGQYMQITSGITMATPGDLKNMTSGNSGPIPFQKK